MHGDERTAPELRRGFCPSAWTPMESGDGLLVRVHASARSLSARDLRSVAELARAAGNGVVELTRRANLQLRGVSASTLGELQRALVERALVDADPVREQRRSWLLGDPYAGLVQGAYEIEPLLRELEAALARIAPGCASPKFAIGVAGARREVAALALDLALVCTGDAVELHVATRSGLRGLVGLYAGRAVEATLLIVERALATPGARVRDLVEACGFESLRGELVERGFGSGGEPPALAPAPLAPPLGFHREPLPLLELALPFGAGSSEQWEAIADLAERYGDGSVRVTPQRSLLFPNVRAGAEALAHARAAGLIADPDDPLLRVAACSGAPRCGSARGDTRELARSLAPLLPSAATLHVSGCEKGCAASGATTVAVVHAVDGCKLAYESDAKRALASPSLSVRELQPRLADRFAASKVSASMGRKYDYERDPAAIYRRSFAIIRSEANLARFSPSEERVVVRMIHTSGSVELADRVVFSPGFAEAAERAIRAGAPVLCDANMIVSGVTRSRLSRNNELVCLLDHPDTPALARERRTTRSAAAIDLLRDRLEGAVVAIGNAPTALFRLLELFDEVEARPAAILGLPVGFVGAVESKEALLADGRVPAMIVRGRRGGSALAVAAINALARDEE